MKKTTRILSLVLCLAMLVGVFAATASAEEATETILFEEDFADQPVGGVGHWSTDYHTNAYSWIAGTPANTENQHVKLVHNSTAANSRVYIGYVMDKDAGITFEMNNTLPAKDLSFDAKIEDGTDMKIEFYVVWNLTKADSTLETVTRAVSLDVKGGKIYQGTTEIGQIDASVDTSEWHNWTVRVSRRSKYDGKYDIQLMVDGINYVTDDTCEMGTQGDNPQERVAIHARSAGSIEIDNLKVDELYLDARKGAVTTGKTTNLWKSGFGALGTTLTYDDTNGSYTAGQWKRGIDANTDITMVEDAATGGDGTGYLKASWGGTNDRYANAYLTDIIPVDATVYLQFDLKLDGGTMAFQLGGGKNEGGVVKGRQMYADFRPDGVYYTTPDGTQKSDIVLPSVTEWTRYIIKLDFSAQKATVYANGTELGDIRLNNLTYSTTSTNMTQLKIVKRGINSALTGSAYVDNIKVSYGVDLTQQPQGPGNTADASIIGLAAMMLPVSGIGLGALCLKRKKEN